MHWRFENKFLKNIYNIEIKFLLFIIIQARNYQ